MNSLHPRPAALFLCLAVLLGACTNRAPEAPSEARYQRDAWEHLKPGCQGEDCPLVNIDTLRFADEPQLNRLIEQSLLDMTREDAGATPPASLQAYEQEFLARAQPRWSSYLQAKVLEQGDGRILLQLSSYLFTGGAHGMPGRRLLDYDLAAQKALSLKDLIEPGTEPDFWRLAEQAHARWLQTNGFNKDAQFLENWPFEQTDQVGLTHDGLQLLYGVTTLGPYSVGHPVLTIPYSDLRGVLRKQYFPH
jgi:hypothetical protein